MWSSDQVDSSKLAARLRPLIDWTLTWAIENDPALGLRVITSLDRYWRTTGWDSSVMRWLGPLLEAAAPDDPGRPYAEVVRIEQVLVREGPRAAMPIAVHALELAKAAGVPRVIRRAYTASAQVFHGTAEFVRSAQCMIDAAEWAEDPDDRAGLLESGQGNLAIAEDRDVGARAQLLTAAVHSSGAGTCGTRARRCSCARCSNGASARHRRPRRHHSEAGGRDDAAPRHGRWPAGVCRRAGQRGVRRRCATGAGACLGRGAAGAPGGADRAARGRNDGAPRRASPRRRHQGAGGGRPRSRRTQAGHRTCSSAGWSRPTGWRSSECWIRSPSASRSTMVRRWICTRRTPSCGRGPPTAIWSTPRRPAPWSNA